MNIPGSSTAKISDLIPMVQTWLQNRTDVSESQTNPEMRPSRWLRDALREITANLPFEELRQPNPPRVVIGPGLGFNGSTYQYPVSQFLNSGDDVTLMEDPVIFLNPPSNTIPYPMDYLTPKAIAPMFVVSGIPFRYTRFGNQFWFAQPPNQNYTVYIPYQVRHDFNDDNVGVSAVRVPPEWFDIITAAAAHRGAVKMRWNEQASYLHGMLFGDPKADPPRVGLIEERRLQQERDRRISTVQVTPMVQRY